MHAVFRKANLNIFPYLVDVAESINNVLVDGVVQLGEGRDRIEATGGSDFGVGWQSVVATSMDDGGQQILVQDWAEGESQSSNRETGRAVELGFTKKGYNSQILVFLARVRSTFCAGAKVMPRMSS